MTLKLNIVANTADTKAILIEKCPYGYRLVNTARNLAGEWARSFGNVENRIFKTQKAAKERAAEILAQA